MYIMSKYYYTIIDWTLIGSLIIALVCSIIITVEVFYYKNQHYKKTFSTWQMPMIFAILMDLYLYQ
jgi:hypothetical protein